jgi:hypothetical protein
MWPWLIDGKSNAIAESVDIVLWTRLVARSHLPAGALLVNDDKWIWNRQKKRSRESSRSI